MPIEKNRQTEAPEDVDGVRRSLAIDGSLTRAVDGEDPAWVLHADAGSLLHLHKSLGAIR